MLMQNNTIIIDNIIVSSGEEYTNYFEGYIKLNTTKTVNMRLDSDDDSYVWIYKGNLSWTDIGNSITNNLPCSQLSTLYTNMTFYFA